MNLIVTLIAFILPVLIFLIVIRRWKKSTKKITNERGWIFLINDFKAMAPKIKEMNQLESYLQSIQGKIKRFENDYDFLIAYNSIIEEVRIKLKQDI